MPVKSFRGSSWGGKSRGSCSLEVSADNFRRVFNVQQSFNNMVRAYLEDENSYSRPSNKRRTHKGVEKKEKSFPLFPRGTKKNRYSSQLVNKKNWDGGWHGCYDCNGNGYCYFCNRGGQCQFKSRRGK